MAQADFSFLPFGAGGIPANENSGTSLPAPRWYYGTAAPTTGNYYNLGDILWNTNQVSGGVAFWVCYSAGAGGTALFQAVYSSGGATSTPQTVTATTGTLSTGIRTILLNPATTGTYSLPEALSFTAGSRLTIKSIAAGPVTLAPLTTDQLEATAQAAITLTQNQAVDLFNNTSIWYNEQNPQPLVLTTTATSGTLSNAYRLTVLNPASTGTYSLPEATSVPPGTVMTFNAIQGPCTLTPLSSDTYQNGVAAITLATNAVISIINDSTTHWFKAA